MRGILSKHELIFLSEHIQSFKREITMQNTPSLLLIEDDTGIITPLSIYLEQSQFHVIPCSDGRQALEIYKKEKPSVIILDINLPWRNGIDICRDIREIGATPIIILSARESEDDKVTLLDLGADDYVSKPFSPRELVARIHAVLKRVEGKKEQKWVKTLTLWTIILDNKNHHVTLAWAELKLTKTEFSLLEYFIKNHKSVIKRESLMKDIIGYDQYIYDRTIDTHIKNLRKKIGASIEIETIRGVWYRVREL